MLRSKNKVDLFLIVANFLEAKSEELNTCSLLNISSLWASVALEISVKPQGLVLISRSF